MKTIAQSYIGSGTRSGDQFVTIGRIEMADVYSNNNRSWIEFCDGSVLDMQYGELKAFKKLQRFHNKGVTW